jgi:hypothetical protein
MRQLCAKNYSETVLHCHFYYDIQTLSLQRTDIPLNHRRFMYRKEVFALNRRYSPIYPAWPTEGIFVFFLAQNLKSFVWSFKSAVHFPCRGKMRFQIQPGDKSVKPCNLHIIKTLKMAEEMMDLADQGDADREDNGCGILYGVLRDSAYKLKKLAEEEKQNHIVKGRWQEQQ